jgi:hypothetical protein
MRLDILYEDRDARTLAQDIIKGQFDPFTDDGDVLIDFDLGKVPVFYNIRTHRPGMGLGWVAFLGFLAWAREAGVFMATHQTSAGAHLLEKARAAGLIEPVGNPGLAYSQFRIMGDPEAELRKIAG